MPTATARFKAEDYEYKPAEEGDYEYNPNAAEEEEYEYGYDTSGHGKGSLDRSLSS